LLECGKWVKVSERFGSGDGEQMTTMNTTDQPRAVACIRFVRLLPRWAKQALYAPAIHRLDDMAADIKRDIDAEKDPSRRDRLMKEYLICSSASSFLVNDE
jgi:hypothetical protein